VTFYGNHGGTDNSESDDPSLIGGPSTQRTH